MTIGSEGDLQYLLLLVEVREHWETPLAPELGAPHDDGLVGRNGDVQVPRIRLAHLGHGHGHTHTHTKLAFLSSASSNTTIINNTTTHTKLYILSSASSKTIIINNTPTNQSIKVC